MWWGYGPDYGMMGWGYGHAFGLFHMIFWVVVLGVLIAAVIWLGRTMAAPGGHAAHLRRSAGLDVLEERYARGEINRDEYLEKKRDISG